MKTDKEIVELIRSRLPVGYIPNHTSEEVPSMVEYHVHRSSLLGALADEADAILKREDCCMKHFIRFMNRLIEVEQTNIF